MAVYVVICVAVYVVVCVGVYDVICGCVDVYVGV